MNSRKMKNLIKTLKGEYNYVFLDTPPLLSVSDSMILMPDVDGVILVLWGGKTSREALKRAKERLDMTDTKTLGVVLNRVNLKEHESYFRHHYYLDEYYYGQEV